MIGLAIRDICDSAGDLHDEGAVRAGAIELGVLHTPGHTPGSVSFVLTTPAGAIAFTGDTLFRRGIGRSDLWGGDGPKLMASLRRRLLTLDDATRVVPGHGPGTTIGEERRSNPFLRGG